MSAQPTTNAEKTDSLLVVLPQLSGDERLEALSTLINLTAGLSAQKDITFQYLNEARRQKNAEAESTALLRLTLIYYAHLVRTQPVALRLPRL